MKIPLRTKANIRFDSKHAVWKYGNLMGVRSAKKLKGALMLLRTMYVLEFIRDMIRDSKSSTLREMYYISEGWDIAKFHAQEESNLLAEDLEVITQLLREDFKLRPEESGASVIGNLTLEEVTRGGDRKRINCRDDVGDAGYTIPYNVENEKVKLIEADAKFILAIETGGMFDRLVENGFDDEAKCILVHLKGQPSRSTRRLLKRLNEELKLNVCTFTDGDPWSFRIHASVAYGAIKTAHISEYLAAPTAEFLGITASDILNYELPTDVLTARAVGALNAEMSDPRFNDEFWRNEIQTMLQMNKKAEQQALAKYGLDYVTDTYLPEKLGSLGLMCLMASREFLEDGTEGPFHPYRSFATRAIRADVESPRGQEDEFRLVASSDFARLRYQRAHIRLSGLPSGCLRRRRGRRQRRLLRWRRWHLGPATSPANDQGNQDQGGDDRHSRDGRVESERRARGEREVRGHLGGAGHGHRDARPIARRRTTPLGEHIRGGRTRHDRDDRPGWNVQRLGRTARDGSGRGSVREGDRTAIARMNRESRIQDGDFRHRPDNEDRRTRLRSRVGARSAAFPDAHGPSRGGGYSRRQGESDIVPAGSRRDRRLGRSLEAEREERLTPVHDLDGRGRADGPVPIQCVGHPTLGRVRAAEGCGERVRAPRVDPGRQVRIVRPEDCELFVADGRRHVPGAAARDPVVEGGGELMGVVEREGFGPCRAPRNRLVRRPPFVRAGAAEDCGHGPGGPCIDRVDSGSRRQRDGHALTARDVRQGGREVAGTAALDRIADGEAHGRPHRRDERGPSGRRAVFPRDPDDARFRRILRCAEVIAVPAQGIVGAPARLWTLADTDDLGRTDRVRWVVHGPRGHPQFRIIASG